MHHALKRTTTALAAMLACLAGSAQATPLDNAFGGASFLDTALGGTTAAARPELAGLVLEDEITPFSFNGVSGTVQNRVVRETSTGTLDFYWRVKVDASSDGAIEAFRLGNFGYSHLTDADWRIDGLGSAAPYVGRLFNPANPSSADGDINFLFTDPPVRGGDPADGGSGSRFFFLRTSATAYAQTATYDLLCGPSNCISPMYKTFAPAVPEPGTYGLMALGLAGIAAVARRRRRD